MEATVIQIGLDHGLDHDKGGLHAEKKLRLPLWITMDHDYVPTPSLYSFKRRSEILHCVRTDGQLCLVRLKHGFTSSNVKVEGHCIEQSWVGRMFAG
jgi:hypothetical protein